ncbi:MAG: tetratricopeptide repeat protein [Rudaea sp.]
MLGDLNDKLDQVHRLDIMQAVDDKALAYFDSLPAADATDAVLAMRVQALDKIGGVITEAHGQLAAATTAYESAAALAAELARRAPGDVDRESAWAASLNMVGIAHWQQGDLAKALKYWRSTSTLLQKAYAAKPDDPKIISALASVKNNIGHVLEARGDFAGAQAEYEARLKLQQSLAASAPDNAGRQADLASAWDSLGKLALERGQLDRALVDYRIEHHIKSRLASAAPQDRVAQEDLLVSNAILGRTLAWCGETDAGLRYTSQAVAQAKTLLAFDPANTGWREDFALYAQQAGGLLRQLGRIKDAQAMDAQAVETLEELLKKDPISSDFQQELSQAQLESARLQLARGGTAAALALVQSAHDGIGKLRTKTSDNRTTLLLDAQAALLLGRIAAQRNDNAGAQDHWMHTRDLLQPALRAGDDPNFLAAFAEALLRLNQTDAAMPAIAELNAMGYRTPDLVALLARKRINYPANTAFQSRIAQIMQADNDATTFSADPSISTLHTQ